MFVGRWFYEIINWWKSFAKALQKRVEQHFVPSEYINGGGGETISKRLMEICL